MLPKPMKIFLESSVVLGAAQDKLLESPQLDGYIQSKFLQKPERYIYSRKLVEKIFELLYRGINLEPFVSRKVKEEVKNLVDNKTTMEKKILRPLRIDENISGLSEPDRRIFDITVYQIFIIKLPIFVDEIIDEFSSTFVDRHECSQIVDDLFFKVYRPLITRLKFLAQNFELSGVSEKEKESDPDYKEYKALKLVLQGLMKNSVYPFGFWPYKNFFDFMILSEAIFANMKMKRELVQEPDFYFISNDKIFMVITVSGMVYDKVSKIIKKEYGINVLNSKDMVEVLEKI